MSALASAPSRLETYLSVVEWLFQEAALLDEGRFDEWLDLLADDLVYQVPVRVTRERGARMISTDMFHLEETRESLSVRTARLNTEFAWAEDPPSRTRHFVSNTRILSEAGDEVETVSCLLVYRNRGGDSHHDLLSGERRDTLRRVNDGWRLARREVILDQATLGTKNLGIFL